jgi:hypothetical protein
VALTTAQRNRLPRRAFLYAPKGSPRSRWRYPVPTRAQARAAGISEAQRQRIAKSAVAYSAHRNTIGSRSRVEPIARQRAGATPRRATGRKAATRARQRPARRAVTRSRARLAGGRARTRR